MGCGSSSVNTGPYPRQAYSGGGTGQGYPNNQRYGRVPVTMMGAPANQNDQFAEGALAGAALGYGMYPMSHGGMGMGVPMGQELPLGYHLGPQLPQHNVEVMGVDVM